MFCCENGIFFHNLKEEIKRFSLIFISVLFEVLPLPILNLNAMIRANVFGSMQFCYCVFLSCYYCVAVSVAATVDVGTQNRHALALTSGAIIQRPEK